MNPDFVEDNGKNEHGSRLLKICGKEYIAHGYDWYIDQAIRLAESWQSEERNFERIVHLRGWIRENAQHAHDVNYTKLKTMEDCKVFIDAVIDAEYSHTAESSGSNSEEHSRYLKENKLIFSGTNQNPTHKQTPRRRIRF